MPLGGPRRNPTPVDEEYVGWLCNFTVRKRLGRRINREHKKKGWTGKGMMHGCTEESQDVWISSTLCVQHRYSLRKQ